MSIFKWVVFAGEKTTYLVDDSFPIFYCENSSLCFWNTLCKLIHLIKNDYNTFILSRWSSGLVTRAIVTGVLMARVNTWYYLPITLEPHATLTQFSCGL